jgi:hypothetical protein
MKAFAVLAPTLLTLVTSLAVTAETLQIATTPSGQTPEVLGYNLAHMVQGSNAADFWRYTGAKGARVFISASHVEAQDDLAPVGDGVGDAPGFAARKQALRAHVKADSELLGNTYVDWSKFKSAYSRVDTNGNNTFAIDPAFSLLREQGVAILANITCSPSRFPLNGSADWAGLWEIWQHYYAQAFYLASTYGVARYGLFNEPNNWSTAISPEDWWLRVKIASDAVQAAVADVNQSRNKQLVAQVFAPNTANGATKYDDPQGTGDYWGRLAVTERHLRLDGSQPADWLNFHLYNYQKYTTLQRDAGTSSGYIDDFNELSRDIARDMSGETPFPLALTEFNARTGASYDGRSNHADTPEDYASLGASLVALSSARQLYLFKFGMTRNDGNYPVAKNGTHYVDNALLLRPYGGAASTAEIYRLFIKAAEGARPVHAVTGVPTDLWVLATRHASGALTLFVANKSTSSRTLDFVVGPLGYANGSLATTEEISGQMKGGVKIQTRVASGKVPSAVMPAQSVWLVTVTPSTSSPTAVIASENTELADGSGRTLTGGGKSSLLVRADGTQNGRRVSLFKFPLASSPANAQRVLLRLRAGTASRNTPVQAHVYGLLDDSWREASASFATQGVLKQNVPAGTEIAHNVVEDARTNTRLLGQVWVNSTSSADRLLDVTEFVRGRTGQVSFMVVQDHRWSNANHLGSGTGDLQGDGVRILSRRNKGAEPTLRIWYR